MSEYEGWALLFDSKGQDGITFKQSAFDNVDGKKVSLVWNHDYSDPANIIGSATFERKKEGIWAKARVNAKKVKGQEVISAIENGDLNGFSTGIANAVRRGNDVINGELVELSITPTPANKKTTLIKQSLMDPDDLESPEMLIIGSGNIFKQSVDDSDDDKDDSDDDKDIDDILSELSSDELDTLATELENENVDIQNSVESGDITLLKQSLGEIMEQSAFKKAEPASNVITTEMKTEIAQSIVRGDLSAQDAILKQGITNLEVLFPEYNDPQPKILEVQDPATVVLDLVQKVPRGQIRSRYINMTEDEYRALGYIKGDEKIEGYVEAFGRKTLVQTVYKYETVENDDLIDLEGNFDLINFYWEQMGIKIREELARAIIVGDGRLSTDRHKIDPNQIRPIASDVVAYTTQVNSSDPRIGTGPLKVEDLVRANAKIKAPGKITAFINRETLTELCIQDSSTFQVNGSPVIIPANFMSPEEIRIKIGVDRLVVANWIKPNTYIASVLGNYQLGTPKGGELKRHQDFVLKYNRHEFLLETRLGGAQTVPKSTVVLTKTP